MSSSSTQKTVSFYGIYLSNALHQEEPYTLLKSIFSDIFLKHSVNNGTNGVLVLEKGKKQVTMDILSDTDDFLFGRLGRLRENNEIQFRNLKNLSCEEILTPLDADEKGIEAITYFIIDYKKAILSIIKGQYAPHQGCLNNIINYYKPDYTMELKAIVNKDSISTILKGDFIREIVYDMSVPSPELLTRLPGLSEQQVMELRKGDTNRLSISITTETKRGALVKCKDGIKGIIQDFTENSSIFKDIKFKTKLQGKSPEYYSLMDSIFTYKVNISNECKNNRLEQEKEFYERLKEAYNEEKEDLLVYCDRYR